MCKLGQYGEVCTISQGQGSGRDRIFGKVQRVQFLIDWGWQKETALKTGSMQRMRANWLALFARMKYPTGQ